MPQITKEIYIFAVHKLQHKVQLLVYNLLGRKTTVSKAEKTVREKIITL